MVMMEKGKWQTPADLLSRAIHGQAARLEVGGSALGDPVEMAWARFHGITYDPKDDLFEVQLEGVDHPVRHPRQAAFPRGPRQRELPMLSLITHHGYTAERLRRTERKKP